MSEGYEVELAVLDTDAKLWEGWSGDLDTILTGLDTKLQDWEFSTTAGGQVVLAAWKTATAAVETYVETGKKTFKAFGENLAETSKKYSTTESESAELVTSFELEG